MKDEMTTVELRNVLRVSRTTVLKWFKSGKMKAEKRIVKGRGKWFVTREQIEQYLKEQNG